MTLFSLIRFPKGLLSLAVVSWMLLPLASTPAQAFSSCPCNFTSTLLYSKQTARTFDSKFEYCSIRTDDRILLAGNPSSTDDAEQMCRLTFEVGQRNLLVEDERDSGECTARVECGNTRQEATDQSLVARPPGLSTLQNRWVLDDRTARACERELKWLIRLARAPQCEEK